MAGDLRATITANGVTVVDVTPKMNAGNWSSAAMGGYASAQLTLPGIRITQVPFLALLRLTRDTDVLFEGTIQDRTLTIDDSGASTTVQAFGLRQKLADTSLHRIWVKRDFNWQTISASPSQPACASGTPSVSPSSYEVRTGQFDETDLTRIGVRFIGTSTTAGRCEGVWAGLSGATGQQILFDITRNAAAAVSWISTSPDGNVWTDIFCGKGATAKTAQSVAIPAGHMFIRLAAQTDGATAPDVTFENIRVLGATTTEDATGGLYGGTILRDVIAQVPDLAPGIIEDGSDFTIQALDRATRDTAESVVTEVAGYYTREWAVWEGGVTDWKSVDLNTAGYLLTTGDLQSFTLEATVEGTPSQVIVQYQDVAGNQAEATATSTDQRNPLVKQGKTRDEIVQVSFAMTNVTAAQLAQRIAADHGSYPTANGRAVLSLLQPIRRANGGLVPAYMLRGGENIAITDLPKTDAFATGRDGETLFHVTDAEADLDKQTVTLAFEGQIRRSDVLVARLSAATRVLTG